MTDPAKVAAATATLARQLGSLVGEPTLQVNRIEWFGDAHVTVELQVWPTPASSKSLGSFTVPMPDADGKEQLSCYDPLVLLAIVSAFPYGELRDRLAS